MTRNPLAVVRLSDGTTVTKLFSQIRRGERFWKANASGVPVHRDPYIAVDDARLVEQLAESSDGETSVWTVNVKTIHE